MIQPQTSSPAYVMANPFNPTNYYNLFSPHNWASGPLGTNLFYAIGMRNFLGRNDYGVPWGGLWNYALGGPSWMRSY